jgi:hypothetical protein
VKVLIGLLLFASALMGRSNDWFMVPGSRVGPITSATNHADLIDLFGAANVVDEDVSISDVGPEPGTVVFKNRPYDSLVIVWSPEHKISTIVFCAFQSAEPKSCHWHTGEGITFGTTLKTIERLNGGAFDLAGFGWDYGGTVLDWKGGRLAPLRATSCGQVVVRFEAHPQNPSQKRLYEQFAGDRPFLSSLPGMKALNPRVESLEFSFADCILDSRPPAQ